MASSLRPVAKAAAAPWGDAAGFSDQKLCDESEA